MCSIDISFGTISCYYYKRLTYSLSTFVIINRTFTSTTKPTNRLLTIPTSSIMGKKLNTSALSTVLIPLEDETQIKIRSTLRSLIVQDRKAYMC